MSDPTEFTPKEAFQISLFKEPKVLFSRSLTQAIPYIAVSIALVAYSVVADDMAYGLMGYAVLLYQAIMRLILLKRGAGTIACIIRKYEARIQKIEAS
jgi:hypothetical protein